nr:hypothetical protein [Lachnospiraceae bacterium]
MPDDEEQRPVYQEEYAHGTWKAEATIFEQQLARKLYDQQLVRQAGQTALSKVSTLLVRYNRLKLLEQDMNDDFRGDRKEAKESLENTLAAIETQRAELDKITDAADRQKAADALKKQEDAAKERYDKRIAAIDKAVAGMEAETLKTDMDRDIDGGIRSALMLGGKAEGGRGYNLSTAGTDDTVKAGLYIDEVAGNEGNLFDQMGLLENAVNTGTLNNGTVVEEEDENGEKKTVTKGKIHDLRDILTNMTEEDYARMNKDIHGNLGFSYKDINDFRTSGDLATKMGEAQKTTFDEDLFKERETKEAKERRKGSHVGVFKKMYHHFFGTTRQANMGTKMVNTSWLGDLGTIPDRIKKNNYEVV